MHPTHTPPDVDLTPAVILRGAARYLQRHGWHQGTLYADGPHTTDTPSNTPAACALGAISLAALGTRISTCANRRHIGDYQHASDVFGDYLDLSGAKPPLTDQDGTGMSIGDWNDTAGRTADEVITALLAAADDWDRLHTPPAGDRS